MADRSKDIPQSFTLFLRHTLGIVDINTGKFQRRFFNYSAGEGIDIFTVRLFNLDIALSIHLQNHRSDFQQCVGARIKATGFNVDYDRQKSTKALGDIIRRRVIIQFIDDLRHIH